MLDILYLTILAGVIYQLMDICGDCHHGYTHLYYIYICPSTTTISHESSIHIPMNYPVLSPLNQEFHAVFVISFSQVMPVRLAALDLYQQAFSDLECFEKVRHAAGDHFSADPTGWYWMVESNPRVFFQQKHGTSPKRANEYSTLFWDYQRLTMIEKKHGISAWNRGETMGM